MGAHKQTYKFDIGFVNTDLFRQAAIYFEKHGVYTDAPPGTKDYLDFWQQEADRVLNGYCIGGTCITGTHYYYLNYTRIKKSVSGSNRKVEGFPDFWDGDFDFFWNWEIARYGFDKKKIRLPALYHLPDELEGGHNLLVVKARRKGFSYKASAIASREYNFYRNSHVLLTTYNDQHLDLLWQKTMDNINFINEHTAWFKRRQKIDKQGEMHIRASYLEKDPQTGIDVEKGYKSEIVGKTFYKNKNVARGGDYDIIIIDEAGSAGPPGTLKKVIQVAKDTQQDGQFVTGNMLVFGTSGEMDSGSVDLAELAYDPALYNFMSYKPDKDDAIDEEEGKVCYFFPIQFNLPGLMDRNGNSKINEAIRYEKSQRQKFIDAGDMQGLIAHKAERPMNLSEAFDIKDANIFSAIPEVKQRLDYLKYSKVYKKIGTPVELYYKDGKVEMKEKPNCQVLWESKHYNNKEGCVVIYEMPDAPLYRYKYIIGYDPYRHDDGTSLGAAYVYKTALDTSNTHSTIVASYIGRPKTFDKYNDILIMLAEFYNAMILYENEVPAVKTYFQSKKKLHLLERQPDDAIKSIIPHSTVNRVYGVHMPDKLKYTAEVYFDKWLLEIRNYDEDGNPIRNVDLIYDIGLLQETVKYNRKINTDRVSAMFILMLFLTQIDLDITSRRESRDEKKEQLMEYFKKYI